MSKVAIIFTWVSGMDFELGRLAGAHGTVGEVRQGDGMARYTIILPAKRTQDIGRVVAWAAVNLAPAYSAAAGDIQIRGL